jgi:hypothetical protein
MLSILVALIVDQWPKLQQELAQKTELEEEAKPMNKQDL